MNLSHARFARRTGGGRPGAPVCNPGEPANNVGMLGEHRHYIIILFLDL